MKSGAADGNRTRDLRLTKASLYPLATAAVRGSIIISVIKLTDFDFSNLSKVRYLRTPDIQY